MNISEIPASKIAIISMVFLVLLMLYSGTQMKPVLDNTTTSMLEGNLVKNTNLKIMPKEEYIYAYKMGNESVNVTYNIMKGPGCTAIYYKADNGLYSCVDSNGNDVQGMNSTLSNPLIFMFKPWMLAVDENWKWDTKVIITISGVRKEMLHVNYSTIRTDIVNGRKAYVVRVSTENEPDSILWVDDEKRILLKEIGTTYEIELVSEIPRGS